MSKWPLPNLVTREFGFEIGINEKPWFRSPEVLNMKNQFQTELPKGWGNLWPDLPNPDEEQPGLNLNEIKLSTPRNPCAKPGLLGYYISWHIVGISFQNEEGRPPFDGNELKQYNDSLPAENRFGIHICCNTIESYISRFSTEGLEPNEKMYYLEYCTFLTMLYVIAHEWGHYRSEVLSFQIGNLFKSVTGEEQSRLSPSYLSYFKFKKEYPITNFEEVFAEWAALKLGVFNYHIKKPAFANKISNWPQVEATVKFMLTQAISNPERIRPYSDIRFWIDFKRITRLSVLKRFSENSRSINRAVNDNVLLENIRSFKNGKMIDLLMHNQMQFAESRCFNGLITSAPLAYPLEPDSLFYHFGDDECLTTDKATYSDRYLRLSNIDYSNPSKQKSSLIRKAIDVLKENEDDIAFMPIKVFTDILPLDPVYFHGES